LPATPVIPTQHEEHRLHRSGYLHVVGIDEVGRGPLAGPVVAAAVVLPDLAGHDPKALALVRDSKTLSHRQRQLAAVLVRRVALAFGVGEASSGEIDAMGIAPATRLAMRRALARLSGAPHYLLPDYLLVDGTVPLVWNNLPCTPVVKGDRLCTAIAAASVIAKVHRDALMADMDGLYPGYGFAGHKGYASRMHLEALERLGPSPEHRRSFSPLRQRLALVFAESHS
jgi:ribonuclease HII